MTKIKETLRSINFINRQSTKILAHFSSFQILAHYLRNQYMLICRQSSVFCHLPKGTHDESDWS